MRTHARYVPAIVAALVSLTVTGALSATPVLAGETCPNEQLRAESLINPATHQPYSTQLPDCRAYELVSPTNSDGLPVLLGPSWSVYHQFLTTLGGAVFWQSQATPPGTGALPNGTYPEVFRSRRTASGWSSEAILPHSQAGKVELVAASTNGSSALIETPLTLSPEDLDNPTGNINEGRDLYVVREGGDLEFVTHGEVSNRALGEPVIGNYVGSNPELTAVGFVTSLSLAASHEGNRSTAGCYIWSDVQGGLAQPTDNDETGTTNPERNCEYFAVAADGRPIIRVTNNEQGNGEFFAVDPGYYNQLLGGTQRLAGQAARFVAMSPSDRTVYLSTTEELTSEGAGETYTNLYAIGLDGESSTCISCYADGGTNTAEAHYVGESADGSHVYFTIAGALYQRDAAGIRELAPASDELSYAELSRLVFSENGEYIIDITAKALSPSDTNGSEDVYELRAGESPRLITDGSVVASSGYHAIGVSSSGGRVIYGGYEGGSYEVIYEWTEGKTAQISPVDSPEKYKFLGIIGPELENVFFASNEPLVAQDENAGTTDIYDARIDGGFPAPKESPDEANTPNPTPPATPAFTPNLTTQTGVPGQLPPDTSQPVTSRQTKASKLEAALRSCAKMRARAKRPRCERAARKRYGVRSKTATKKGGRR